MTQKYLHLAGFALVLSLSGCWDAPSDPTESGDRKSAETDVDGQGGTSALGGAASGGKTQTDAALGGATERMTTTAGDASGGVGTQPGGASASSKLTEAGGSSQTHVVVQTGGNAQTLSSTEIQAQGGNLATGGSRSSGSASGGVEPTGGTTSVASTAQAGAGGNSGVIESICLDGSGAPVPYDYSFGLMGEYAFALSMSCEVGGYVLPLVMADPEQLSQVNAFVAEATDWYRAQVLNCSDSTTQLGADDYGLLPVSPNSELSGADCDASLALFLTIIDRHDSQPDAVSASTKDKIKHRINSIKARAVRNGTGGLTKMLTEPDCIPSEPANGG